MKIHEYQGKAILGRHGVPVPRGEVAFTPEDARAVAGTLGGEVVVVKAQIHAAAAAVAASRSRGARPKPSRSRGRCSACVWSPTRRAPRAAPCRLLIEQGVQIARELYLGLVIDRSTRRAVLMVSPDGGVEIEKVAAETPARIFKVAIHPALGLQPFEARSLAFQLGLAGDQIGKAVRLMIAVYQAFVATDASLLEINPLIVTASGDLMALDANAEARDPKCARLNQDGEVAGRAREAPEVEASKFSLNYIKLDGTIGCMVNGAVWRWPRWTSSSWRAASRPIFSMSGVAPTPNR
jgi:succinyl-CoA synthetase beta subunit